MMWLPASMCFSCESLDCYAFREGDFLSPILQRARPDRSLGVGLVDHKWLKRVFLDGSCNHCVKPSLVVAVNLAFLRATTGKCCLCDVFVIDGVGHGVAPVGLGGAGSGAAGQGGPAVPFAHPVDGGLSAALKLLEDRPFIVYFSPEHGGHFLFWVRP